LLNGDVNTPNRKEKKINLQTHVFDEFYLAPRLKLWENEKTKYLTSDMVNSVQS